MKHTMKHNLLVLLLAASLPLLAADKPGPHADPFAGAFFPPELVFLARDQIGLTAEQQEAFQGRVEKTRYQSRSEELRVKLERETAALAALARQERVDEAVILAQLDKVLDAERELKHLHTGFGVALKNLLTPAQQAKLHEIAKGVTKGSDGFHQLEEATSKRIAEKIERVQAGVKQWAESGRDPSAIGKAMEETVGPLLKADKPMEVEAALDRVLKQLTSQPGAKPKAPAKESAATVTAPTEAVRKRLTDKVALVQAGVQKWVESGRDPSPIARAMQEEFRPLLDGGKASEAEAVLERLLERLKPDAKYANTLTSTHTHEAQIHHRHRLPVAGRRQRHPGSGREGPQASVGDGRAFHHHPRLCSG